ncbi:Protein transport protein SSO2 [Wickerhamiella sorbophila]|uniref:Protein transport protein SSO2 n=1 Tax=Wickerhamiella sorbophila TaxID=45607 RepID=A0A2T0FJP0_9ASCO|nr:Protein transport protein SSO2 [Wickerhamiella sorbophila]PRT55202.1 Protein transport protein SSO2 [Wickerhamiella sorbophila]
MSYGYDRNPSYGNNQYEMSEVNSSQDTSDTLAFFKEVEDIKRNLVQYDDNIERIEGLHKRSLAETDAENDEFVQKQIDSLAGETKQLAETLKYRIKTLESKSMRNPTKKTQAEDLKRQFMRLIQKYSATEATFKNRYRDAAARQYRIVRPEATEAEVAQALDSGETQVFQQALLQSDRRGQARTALSEVQARHREIQQIERTMAELAQLFHDMEVLVAEQDEQVTTIDQQAGQAQHDIEAGVAHQNQAIIKAKKWRKKKWWCFIIIFIICAILAIVLGSYFGTR